MKTKQAAIEELAEKNRRTEAASSYKPQDINKMLAVAALFKPYPMPKKRSSRGKR